MLELFRVNLYINSNLVVLNGAVQKQGNTLKVQLTENLLFTLPSTKGMVWELGRENRDRLEGVGHELKLLKQN